MIDTPERITEISEKLDYPFQRTDLSSLILIASMLEYIVEKNGLFQCMLNSFGHSVKPGDGEEWFTDPSLLEATYAAWQAVQENKS